MDPWSKPSPTHRPNTWFGSQVKVKVAFKSLKVSSKATKGVVRGGAMTHGQGQEKGKVAGTTVIHGANAKGKRKA